MAQTLAHEDPTMPCRDIQKHEQFSSQGDRSHPVSNGMIEVGQLFSLVVAVLYYVSFGDEMILWWSVPIPRDRSVAMKPRVRLVQNSKGATFVLSLN
jgi:hypothetical protein